MTQLTQDPAASDRADSDAPLATPTTPMPRFAALLEASLSLREASLVIYRRRTLVELKTDLLREKLSRWEEEGYVSWQVGAFTDHHVHLDVDGLTRVEFDAQPTGCQGGRLNYTVWFELDEDIGNPFRPRGYFSVTLNAPYTAEGAPRPEVIEPVFALHDLFGGDADVDATAPFVEAKQALRATSSWPAPASS